MTDTSTIGVIGLGKLGLPLACVLADAGYEVTGYDMPNRIEELHSQGPHTWEKGLPELWGRVQEHIKLRMWQPLETNRCELNLVCVQTPPDNSLYRRRFRLGFIKDVIGRDPGRFVLVSTVAPTDCRKLGITVYNPQWIGLGDSINGLTHPPMVLIGYAQGGEEMANMLCRVWQRVTGMDALATSLEEAEIIKLALNAYLCSQVSFGQVLGELCQQNQANVMRVLDGLSRDPRVSTAYMQPGLGYGGPCFVKDMAAFVESAGNPGWLRSMEYYNETIPQLYASRFMPSDKVYITSLDYKEGVPIQEESPYVKLRHALGERDIQIVDSPDEATMIVETRRDGIVDSEARVVRIWDGMAG